MARGEQSAKKNKIGIQPPPLLRCLRASIQNTEVAYSCWVSAQTENKDFNITCFRLLEFSAVGLLGRLRRDLHVEVSLPTLLCLNLRSVVHKVWPLDQK